MVTLGLPPRRLRYHGHDSQRQRSTSTSTSTQLNGSSDPHSTSTQLKGQVPHTQRQRSCPGASKWPRCYQPSKQAKQAQQAQQAQQTKQAKQSQQAKPAQPASKQASQEAQPSSNHRIIETSSLKGPAAGGEAPRMYIIRVGTTLWKGWRRISQPAGPSRCTP